MGIGMPALTRRTAIALFGAVLAHVAFSGPARADDGAEDFVRAIMVEANVVFEAKTKKERFDGIAALVDKYVDMARVSMFVLGQYARQITDAQRAEYYPLFRRYATLVYQEALDEYSGQRLAVVNSVDRSERDIIVNTRIVGAAPGDRFADVLVHWRVYRAADGAMSIFDAGVDQVWLAVEQQSQFKSVIANNGGGAKGIDALIAHLKERLDA